MSDAAASSSSGGGSSQRHHPEQRGSSLDRLGADTPPHAHPALEVKVAGGRNETRVESSLDLELTAAARR